MIWLVAREDLGLYVVAATYAGLTGFLTEPLRWVLVARVARGHSDVAARAVRLAVVGLGGANLLLALLAPVILPLVFGSAFADSVQIAWLLLAAAVPGQAAVVLTAALTASGRPGRSATAQLVALFLSVPGLLLMLPLLGAMGAALVSLIVQTVNLTFLLAFARGHFDLPMRAFLLVNATDLELLRRLARQRLRKVVSVRGKRPSL
jgi:O-antigen/teichoic acid export membrane protein